MERPVCNNLATIMPVIVLIYPPSPYIFRLCIPYLRLENVDEFGLIATAEGP